MWLGIKRKPCQEVTGVFNFGPQRCNILTRRRWVYRRGLKFSLQPICKFCEWSQKAGA